MSSKRAIRRRACKGKVRHETIEAALVHTCARSIATRGDQGPMNAYRCAFCGGFHIGHRPGSRA
jgi:hypothetical protein